MSAISKIMGFFGYVKRELLDNESFKNKLVAQLLGDDSSKNECLAKFHTLLYKDFYDFANKENSLANEAEAFCILQSIEKELEVITIYPELYKKAILGVGGAFSAGKSAFINSFINSDSVNLPISIEPTTAIPTYVLSQEQSTELNAFSHNGAMVNLSALDSEIHSKINHDFIKGFGFRLKKIMPFMVLKTPLYKEYENLCFIDTPGFDAAKDGFSDDDRQSAKEFLNNISALLWLIDITKGTISSEEIGFLSDIDLSNKKLYVVLTKADLMLKDEQDKVINEIRDTLITEGIAINGISVYSAKTNTDDYKKALYDEFLQYIPQETALHSNLVDRLILVYEMYAKAILTKKSKKKAIFDALHSLGLDLAERNINNNDKSRQRLKKIQEIFRIENDDEMLKNLQSIIIEMKNAIDEIFGAQSRELPSIDDMDIEVDFDFAVDTVDGQKWNLN